jgi:hypothetical protein
LNSPVFRPCGLRAHPGAAVLARLFHLRHLIAEIDALLSQ